MAGFIPKRAAEAMTAVARMDQPERAPTIFVSIAAYCDPVLPRTLDDCLATASRPDLLRFGICSQFDEGDPVDLRRYQNDERFRFSDHHYTQSKGGSWARNISQTLWEGETFVLQIDSHMAFAEGWDERLVGMIERLPSTMPIISMICPLFWVDDHQRVYRQTHTGIVTTRLASWKAGGGWAPWLVPGISAEKPAARSRFLSGQFVFTYGKWTDEIRQDPDHYYWGEEFALSLRSYTHGYDIFLPDEIVIWHMLHHKAPPRRHWENGPEVVRQRNSIAFARLHALAYSDDPDEQKSLGRYGLGTKRTRADYERFAGMDLSNKCAHPDVFEGNSPDPMTIASDDDWTHCITFEKWKAQRIRAG